MQDATRLEQLIVATAGGDAQAFRHLYEETSSHLFALLLRMLKRRDWAEEALQDSLLKVWRKSRLLVTAHWICCGKSVLKSA